MKQEIEDEKAKEKIESDPEKKTKIKRTIQSKKSRLNQRENFENHETIVFNVITEDASKLEKQELLSLYNSVLIDDDITEWSHNLTI